MITLTDLTTNQALALPTGLIWRDEFDWSPVESTQTYTLTGALIIEQASKQAGRPVSLSADDDMNWAARSKVDQLRQLAGIVGRKFRLSIGVQTIDVIFDQAKPIVARPVKNIPQHDADDWFHVALNFIEVTE